MNTIYAHKYYFTKIKHNDVKAIRELLILLPKMNTMYAHQILFY